MVNRKKVILIGSAHPLRGGLATFNERLIREYRKEGDDASIYTFTLQYPSLLFPGKTQFTSDPPPEDLPIHVRVNSMNPFNWIRIGMEIKKQKPDLVIVKYWMPFMAPCFGSICRIIKKNHVTRIVSVVDNIIPHEKRPGDRMLSSFWVKSVDGFVAMSQAVLEDLKTFDFRKPKIYCPHPLYDNFGEPVSKQVARSRLKLDSNFRYVLFFGFIRDYKGLDLLIQAFGDGNLNDKKIRLIIAGEFYCDKKPYDEMISRYNLTESVVMMNDFIPNDQVVNYFCAADLVVQPYKSATQSGVTQIAYHFNKPMIITDVGGLAEFVPDRKVGFVVPPEPKEITKAINRYFDENWEEEFSKNASIEKEKYSWRNMLESIDKAAESNNL